MLISILFLLFPYHKAWCSVLHICTLNRYQALPIQHLWNTIICTKNYNLSWGHTHENSRLWSVQSSLLVSEEIVDKDRKLLEADYGNSKKEEEVCFEYTSISK